MPTSGSAYGYALVVHGGNMMSPAAQLAFQRAAAIAPDHPGPRFFYGLALAQGGNYDEAERVWRELLPTIPADRNSARSPSSGSRRSPRRGRAGNPASRDGAVRRDVGADCEQRRSPPPTRDGTLGRLERQPERLGHRRWRILPPETLRPLARCGSAFIAASAP